MAFAFGRSSSPLIPGILMSDRIRMSDCSRASAMRASAILADCAKSIVNRPAWRSRRNCWRKRSPTSGSSSTNKDKKAHERPPDSARKTDPEFGEPAVLRIHLYRPGILLDNDVVAEGKAKARSFTSGFCREKRIEHLFLHLRQNTRAGVVNSDFDAVTEVFSQASEGRFIVASVRFQFALRRRVKAVRDQVEQHARNLLRKHIDLTGGRIKELLKGDIEILLLRPCAVIGEIKALLDDGVDVGGPVLSGSLTGVQQHVLDDRVGAV